jgi:signal transduction histidine kinase
MESEEHRELVAQLLPQISTYMRYAMGNIHFAAAALAPAAEREQNPTLDARAAALDQSYYQLLRLVNNLSVAACLGTDDPMPVRDRDIVGLVKTLCGQCDSLAVLLGLELTFRCEQPFHICAVDRDSIEQLLFQMLSNAFKFTPSGGKVTVELKAERGRVFLSVSDTGRGIEPELLPHLFDRYLQKDAVSLPPHGLGLGLPLCQRIAQLHGGTMLAESRVGHGTTVTLSLPDRQTGKPLLEDHPFDYAGGFNRTLLGLADALPVRAFLLREQE